MINVYHDYAPSLDQARATREEEGVGGEEEEAGGVQEQAGQLCLSFFAGGMLIIFFMASFNCNRCTERHIEENL